MCIGTWYRHEVYNRDAPRQSVCRRDTYRHYIRRTEGLSPDYPSICVSTYPVFWSHPRNDKLQY